MAMCSTYQPTSAGANQGAPDTIDYFCTSNRIVRRLGLVAWAPLGYLPDAGSRPTIMRTAAGIRWNWRKLYFMDTSKEMEARWKSCSFQAHNRSR